MKLFSKYYIFILNITYINICPYCDCYLATLRIPQLSCWIIIIIFIIIKLYYYYYTIINKYNVIVTDNLVWVLFFLF